MRAPDGTITSFDAPDAGTGPGPGQGTIPAQVDGLNPEGKGVGDYIENSNVYHGFVRNRDGRITEFDVPGAGTGPGQGVQPGSINPAGWKSPC